SYCWATRVISRMTDSVKTEVRRDVLGIGDPRSRAEPPEAPHFAAKPGGHETSSGTIESARGGAVAARDAGAHATPDPDATPPASGPEPAPLAQAARPAGARPARAARPPAAADRRTPDVSPAPPAALS